MSSGADFFLKKTLGEDFLQSLEKFELYKIGTRTVIDHEEIKTALKIVPRTLMSFLIHNLTSMNIGDTKELDIPVSEVPAMLRITKHERDVYSGQLEQGNKKVAEFMHRSIPGVGLVVMSALEMYDAERLEEKHENHSPDIAEQVQKMIDDRLALHDLIGKVVDKKIAERDAIQQLVLAKLSEAVTKKKEETINISSLSASKNNIQKTEEKPKPKKVSPLTGFLEERKKKLKKNEHSISLVKGENVSCPDCGKNIFDGKGFSGCICMGQDMDKKLYITKSEDGVKIRFGKGWDPENIEMLLEVLRGKRG